jgi:hypothetical protein
MRHVSKDIFLNTLVCPTLGWILRNEDIPGLTDFNQRTVGEIFRIEQGIELGQRARSLASPGILIEDRDCQGRREIVPPGRSNSVPPETLSRG